MLPDLPRRFSRHAGRIDPKKIATSKRGPKIKPPKAYVEDLQPGPASPKLAS